MTLFVPKKAVPSVPTHETSRTKAWYRSYQGVELLVPRHGTAPPKSTEPLPEASRYIVLRLYLIGIGENLFGIAELHHLTHIKKAVLSLTRAACCLMGNDYNGVLLLQFVYKLLYLSRGNGVEGQTPAHPSIGRTEIPPWHGLCKGAAAVRRKGVSDTLSLSFTSSHSAAPFRGLLYPSADKKALSVTPFTRNP